MDKNSQLKQANFLVENRPKMSKTETRIFLSIIANIKQDDGLKVYKIPVQEFINVWGMSDSHAYEQIEKALNDLSDKSFVLKDFVSVGEEKKARFFKTHYLASAEYVDGQGYIEVEISEKFKPYLLATQEFTLYVLKNVVNLSSVHSIRTYELLKQYENIGIRKFNILEYKRALDIEGAYSKRNDFERHVLKKIKDEINQNTDLLIDYKIEGRSERAIIKFIIKYKNKDKTIYLENINDKLNYIQLAKKILNKYDTDRTAEEYITWLESIIDSEKIKKKVYFEACIKNTANIENFLSQITMNLEKQERRNKALEEAKEVERLYLEGKI